MRRRKQNNREFLAMIIRIRERPLPPLEPILLGYRIAAVYDRRDGTAEIKWLTLESCRQFCYDVVKEKPATFPQRVN